MRVAGIILGLKEISKYLRSSIYSHILSLVYPPASWLSQPVCDPKTRTKLVFVSTLTLVVTHGLTGANVEEVKHLNVHSVHPTSTTK